MTRRHAILCSLLGFGLACVAAERTTNVIESPFAGVRLRTNAAKRFKKTKSGVYLVHQVLVRLSQTWRHLKAAHLCGQVPLPEVKKSKAKTKPHAA